MRSDAARCLTACYVSNHGSETTLAKPFISDSELCCVAGGWHRHRSLQCAVQYAACRGVPGLVGWPRDAAAAIPLQLAGRKTRWASCRTCCVGRHHQLAACKDTSKQRAAWSLRFCAPYSSFRTPKTLCFDPCEHALRHSSSAAVTVLHGAASPCHTCCTHSKTSAPAAEGPHIEKLRRAEARKTIMRLLRGVASGRPSSSRGTRGSWVVT